MALHTLDRCSAQRSAQNATALHSQLHPTAPRRAVAHAAHGRRLSNKKLRAQFKHSAAPAAQPVSRGTAVKTFAVAAAEVKTQVRRASGRAQQLRGLPRCD